MTAWVLWWWIVSALALCILPMVFAVVAFEYRVLPIVLSALIGVSGAGLLVFAKVIRPVTALGAHMVQSGLAGDIRDQQSSDDKSALIREVHHRVNNNLQLISSILNMYMREVASDETRGILRRIQDRVISLATVHADLYESSVSGALSVAPLLHEIADSVEDVALTLGQTMKVTRDFEDVSLGPDQIIPLSLLTAEALNSAMRDVVPGKRLPEAITMTFLADTACVLKIEVKDQAIGEVYVAKIDKQMIQAFAMQLGAEISESWEFGIHRVEIAFVPQNTVVLGSG